MNSVQERLKLKRVPIDTWSVKEKLCLATAVARSGDQNWMSVSRALRLFGEPGRPVDWFSQKSCALQYGNLLENVDTPKRKKRMDKAGSERVETPGEVIVRNLTHERINELKRLLQEERTMYLKLKEEVAQIKAGQLDDKLGEMCQQIEEEEKQKERDAEAHIRWLQERQEKKLELERAWKPPVTPASPHRKKMVRGPGGNRRNSSQSEPSSEADSPLSEPLNVDVIGDESTESTAETKPVAPTPTSPLLTSLLKSPSPAPSAQTSILHSAITSAHRSTASSPTIASLLHSSPGIPASSVTPPPAAVSSSLKNLVTSAIGAAGSEDAPKPSSTSPAAGAPTLSMLLELPPSLPGKPLPELPVSSVAKPIHQHLPPSTTKAGEVCHPQHQEMRVRREVGTDEPVEVVEVEHHADAISVPNLRDQVVEVEVVVGPPDVSSAQPPISSSQSLIDEELEAVTEVIANVTKMEEEEARKCMERKMAAKEPAEAVDKKQIEQVLIDTPIVMEESTPEPPSVAEVVEVPTQGSGTDLDIIIVDSSSLGGQEEVPPVSECQVVEVVVNEKNTDRNKQEVTPVKDPIEPAPVKDKETSVSDGDVQIETPVDDVPQDSNNISEDKVDGTTDAVVSSMNEDSEKKDVIVHEEPVVEVLAIEVPTKEVSKKNVKDYIDTEEVPVIREEVQEIREEVQEIREEVVILTEKNAELPVIKTKTIDIPEVKEISVKELDSSEDSDDQILENDEVGQEEVEADKEVKTRSLEKEVEEMAKDDKVDDEERPKLDDQCIEEKQNTLAAEVVEDTTKQSNDNSRKDMKKESLEEKQDLVTDDSAAELSEAAEKISEATEEDSQAESSEDEKKTDERGEGTKSEQNSTGGKSWKEVDEEEDEEEKKEKSGMDESKQQLGKVTTVQKAVVRAETPSTEDDKTNDAAETARNKGRRGPVTPIDSVPNSPAAPMTDEDREYRAWKKAIMLVYGRIATHKYASLFLRPITDDQAPGYSSIVHRPIDLATIKKNIEMGVTRTTAEFQRDVMLMFLNSIMYNKSSHFVHKMARQMQLEGMQHVQDFLTTQMLVQVVGEAPLRRETRTTEANKQRDLITTPGQEETDGSQAAHNKRKRPEQDRTSSKKRKAREGLEIYKQKHNGLLNEWVPGSNPLFDIVTLGHALSPNVAPPPATTDNG